MELSITSVTRNRRFAKTLIKHGAALKSLEQAVLHIDTPALAFDIIQLVFVDKNENFIQAIGCKGDRLFQIQIGIPWHFLRITRLPALTKRHSGLTPFGEQIIHDLYNPPLDKINGIHPDNPSRGRYLRAGRGLK